MAEEERPPDDDAHDDYEVAREERQRRLRETMRADAAYVRELLANEPDPARSGGHGLSRVIDMRIPLWGVLGSIGALAMVLVTMWFNVQQLNANVAELKTIMSQSGAVASANDRELTRLLSRQQAAEEAIRDIRTRLDNLHDQLNAQRAAAASRSSLSSTRPGVVVKPSPTPIASQPILSPELLQ